MSHTGSAMLSRAQSNIAVAGATGRLGQVLVKTLLTTFKPFFSRVVALTRDASSSRAKELAALGADVIEIRLEDIKPSDEEYIRSAISEIDIMVNLLGVTSLQTKNLIAAAAIESGVKVYFPSEFGVDHRLNDFPGFDHEEWDKKRKHMAYATELATKKGGDVKVIAVYTGLFLEDSINPRFGMDLTSRVFTVVGSASVRTTFTSKEDISRSIAQLSILAMVSPSSLSASISSHVRIAGCTRNVGEIASTLSKTANIEAGIEIKEEALDLAREKLKDESLSGNIGAPAGYIRVLMGEGKLDFTSDHSNELVNPHERLWRWATFEEIAQRLLLN